MTQLTAGISISSRASASAQEAARRALETHERLQGAGWTPPFNRDEAEMRLLAKFRSYVVRVGGAK